MNKSSSAVASHNIDAMVTALHADMYAPVSQAVALSLLTLCVDSTFPARQKQTVLQFLANNAHRPPLPFKTQTARGTPLGTALALWDVGGLALTSRLLAHGHLPAQAVWNNKGFDELLSALTTATHTIALPPVRKVNRL